MEDLQHSYREAVALLHRLTTAHGILASSIEADNYKRIWARDSIVCGLAGILIDDGILIEGLKQSLLSLAKYQHEFGMIPSNVLPNHSQEVSYGSLVGRVDNNTWFIIGACLHFLTTSDKDTWKVLKPSVRKCRDYLKTIEFNGKGWIYTPLSGNWADEYPVHGYTLYDNALRIWGEKLWLKITAEPAREIIELEQRTWTNFWPLQQPDSTKVYQPICYEQAVAKQPKYFGAFILPGLYDLRFDAAGNGLALLLCDISQAQKAKLKVFLDALKTELGTKLIPAFWPVITRESADWRLLEGNYSYDFKNEPGCFHNGGIWPVWMGLFCMGLAKNGLQDTAEEISGDFVKLLSQSDSWKFNEYLNSNDLSWGGKTEMGYTASGIVFMNSALGDQSRLKKLHL